MLKSCTKQLQSCLNFKNHSTQSQIPYNLRPILSKNIITIFAIIRLKCTFAKNIIIMYRTLLILFLLFWKALILSGHDTNYSFTRLSIEQGLSQPTIKSILLDQKGRLWIGTQSGLNYYTQQGIKTYIHNKDNKSSLPNSYINHITEDSIGNIWVSTQKGLAIYDNESDNFTPISSGIIYSSLSIEGGILFGGNNVIYYYDYKRQNMDRIYIYQKDINMELSEYRIQRMVQLKKNYILIGTKEKGIYLYNLQTKQFTHFPPDSHHLLISLYIASDNNIYASFYGDGVYCYDQKGKMQKHYTTSTSNLNNNYILDIMEHKGELWLATDGGGINILKLKTQQFSEMCHIAGDASSLPSNSITILYQDREENLWAGSVRDGIFNIKETYIKTYKDVALNNTNGLSEKAVISLYEGKDNKIWIGTDGGGINFYDPQTDKFTHFSSTYGDKVASITEISESELMVSLYTKGIFIFNKKTKNYRPFTVVNDSVNFKECFYGYLPLAHRVAENKIYIISYRPWVYHLSSKNFSPMHSDENLNIEALRLTYSNSTFSLLKRDNQAFYVTQTNDSISLLFELNKEESITSMTYDGDHIIWTGTDRGLGYYDMKKKEYHHIPTKHFESVSYLLADEKGHLWICAQNMLFSYLIKENKFTLWNSSDGFLPNEILFAYQKMSNKDFIYLGGAEGLVKINTHIPYPITWLPQIYLSDIQYNGSSFLSKIENKTAKIPWNYNSLSIRIQNKNKDIFQKNLFRYIISGRSNQSIESYEPELTLSSLSPDKYAIWISCNTKDGSYTKPLHLIDIIILPPWYETGWFIAIVGFFFICLTVGTGYIFYRRKEKKMKGKITDFIHTVLYNTLNEKEKDKKENKEDINGNQHPDDSVISNGSKEKLTIISKADEDFMIRFNNIINKNLSGEELSIKFLTDVMAMSRASLYNKVKILTGLGVNDYINRLRIEKSVYLLIHTELSINEISYEVGFSYPRYFSTSFKQIKGVTPTRFKEENKKNGADI